MAAFGRPTAALAAAAVSFSATVVRSLWMLFIHGSEHGILIFMNGSALASLQVTYLAINRLSLYHAWYWRKLENQEVPSRPTHTMHSCFVAWHSKHDIVFCGQLRLLKGNWKMCIHVTERLISTIICTDSFGSNNYHPVTQKLVFLVNLQQNILF